ncbi:hypothetical protein L1049_007321 [Liquidambar formosana]|uniref:Uncharacterized protein n=1 Tax=Liquidambar formosana TaxID=63359 RepID=A0AAP0RH11_LIQFO
MKSQINHIPSDEEDVVRCEELEGGGASCLLGVDVVVVDVGKGGGDEGGGDKTRLVWARPHQYNKGVNGLIKQDELYP